MTEPHRQTLLDTAIKRIPSQSELCRAPRERIKRKMKSSLLGWTAALFGLMIMAFAGALIVLIKPMPDWKILAGVAGAGFVMFAFGCLQVDPDTAKPALKTLATLGKKVKDNG